MVDPINEKTEEEDPSVFLGDLRGQRRKDDRKLPLSDNAPEPPDASASPEQRPRRFGFMPRRDR